MSTEAWPKYSLPEIERRWLVDLEAVGDLGDLPHFELEDLYLAGTRLRLRSMAWTDKDPVYKLCKKYGRRPELSEPITNLYLGETEYRLLARLPGRRLRKRRYRIGGGSLDVFEHPHAGLAIFEREFEDEARARSFRPPDFVTREITGDPRHSGATLAGIAEPESDGS